MKNVGWAKAIIDLLFQSGVDEIVVCPGARNAPFIDVLSHWRNAKLHSFFEERSAGFFALGRIAESGRPKAVITTSGTAVANLLPAVIEAHYAGFPLVVVTADRPRSYRGTGSPQTIVQPGIFTGYAQLLGDWEKGELSKLSLPMGGPSHLNICFDEPLIDEPMADWTAKESEPQTLEDFASPSDKQSLSAFCQSAERPLIVVGGVSTKRRELLLAWLKQQKCPMYLEGTSGLRGAIPDWELHAAEKSAKLSSFDAILRIGQVPTIRLWRDLEKATTPVLSISDQIFSGLARRDSTVLQLSQSLLSGVELKCTQSDEILNRDRDEHARLLKLLGEFPLSEPALVHRLSEAMSPQDSVYLGNSLPIREWDLAARRDTCFARTFGNRGVNGIDGQLSSFLGWAKPETKNWGIFGDLTTMYDLSAPWAFKSRPLEDVRIVVINNGGGKIFRAMFNEPLFENRHQTSFEQWAGMWNLPYGAWTGDSELHSGVTEVTPDEEQTRKFRGLW